MCKENNNEENSNIKEEAGVGYIDISTSPSSCDYK